MPNILNKSAKSKKTSRPYKKKHESDIESVFPWLGISTKENQQEDYSATKQIKLMAEKMKIPFENEKDTYLTIMNRFQAKPMRYVKHVLNIKLESYQQDIFDSVFKNPETLVRSCHGAGKSFVAAVTALTFLQINPHSYVITTAPTNRQVKRILWKEIRRMFGRVPKDRKIFCLGQALTQELSIAAGWEAIGFASSDYSEDKFQGIHSEQLLVIVDEACGMADAVWDGIESVLSGDENKLLAIGNPTDPNSRFAQMFKNSSASRFKVSAFDTPNFKKVSITLDEIKSGAYLRKRYAKVNDHLVSPRWVARQLNTHGVQSAFFQSRVLAEFPEASTDSLFQMSWIDAARLRHIYRDDSVKIDIGVDVARFGDDMTAIYCRQGNYIWLYREYQSKDLMHTVGELSKAMIELDIQSIRVDDIGVGGGVTDRLREIVVEKNLSIEIIGINVGKPALNKDKFMNSRAEMFWNLRERFRTGDIAIERDDDKIADELLSIRYRYTSKGQIQIESKDSMKRRGVKSPNRADAVCLCFAEVEKEDSQFVIF